MTEKEIQDILDELNDVRPEILNDKAKRLFEAIMKIANERDELRRKNEELEADNYEANNIIKDLLDDIPVSKVEDKISEYTNRIAKLHPASDIAEIEMLEDKIEALEELLESEGQ